MVRASYRFVGVDGGDLSGSLVSSAGDVDGDGRAYLLIGARQADGIGNGESLAGKTYLIAAADLVALDEADGAEDGVIDLAHVQSGAGFLSLRRGRWCATPLELPVKRSPPPVIVDRDGYALTC